MIRALVGSLSIAIRIALFVLVAGGAWLGYILFPLTGVLGGTTSVASSIVGGLIGAAVSFVGATILFAPSLIALDTRNALRSQVSASENAPKDEHLRASQVASTSSIDPHIQHARQSGSAGFGERNSLSRPKPVSMDVKHQLDADNLREFFGVNSGHRLVRWTVNGDGTVTSETDRLMWAQAPWGTQWDGERAFSGDGLLLSWSEATELFGIGAPVGVAENGTIALSASQLRSTSFQNEYKRGSCRVQFAGYSDWRLPTVADYVSIHGLDWDRCTEVFPRYQKDERYWSATGWTSPLNVLVRASARNAWVYNPGRWLLDCSSAERYPVMLVRSV